MFVNVQTYLSETLAQHANRRFSLLSDDETRKLFVVNLARVMQNKDFHFDPMTSDKDWS